MGPNGAENWPQNLSKSASENQENMLKIRKGKNAIEELRFSPYLVQTAPKIIYKISQNQLMKIEGEKHLQSSNNPKFEWNGKMRSKNYFYVIAHIIQVRNYFFTHFQACMCISNKLDGAIE